MPRYLVNGTITISAYTYVEANSPEEAMRLAGGRDGQLCPHGPEREGMSPWEYAIAEEGDGSLTPTDVEETTCDPSEWE
jgi:hypothetical protein